MELSGGILPLSLQYDVERNEKVPQNPEFMKNILKAGGLASILGFVMYLIDKTNKKKK